MYYPIANGGFDIRPLANALTLLPFAIDIVTTG